MKTLVHFPPEHLSDVFQELTLRGFATRPVGTERQIDLTADGRDWLLMAIWVRLGCPGFPDEWYSTR